MHTTITTQTEKPTPDPLVLSVPEAASVLGISKALGYELAARGDIPTLRLGRRLVVPRARLLALLGEHVGTTDDSA
jgi:excisionase family DNA binding protein